MVYRLFRPGKVKLYERPFPDKLAAWNINPFPVHGAPSRSPLPFRASPFLRFSHRREKCSTARTSCIILTLYGPLSCSGNLLYGALPVPRGAALSRPPVPCSEKNQSAKVTRFLCSAKPCPRKLVSLCFACFVLGLSFASRYCASFTRDSANNVA